MRDDYDVGPMGSRSLLCSGAESPLQMSDDGEFVGQVVPLLRWGDQPGDETMREDASLQDHCDIGPVGSHNLLCSGAESPLQMSDDGGFVGQVVPLLRWGAFAGDRTDNTLNDWCEPEGP